MFEVRQTAVFAAWIEGLKDFRARARIFVRLDRLASGNLGDVKAVGGGVSELRVPYGPGYRVYFKQVGPVIVVLLCGGDKSSQARDIKRARALAEDLS